MSRRLLRRRVASRGVLPRERFRCCGPISEVSPPPSSVRDALDSGHKSRAEQGETTKPLSFATEHERVTSFASSWRLCDRLVRNSSFGGRYKGSSRAVEWLQKYASMPRRGSQGSVRYATPL
jgi:hypothetical protein